MQQTVHDLIYNTIRAKCWDMYCVGRAGGGVKWTVQNGETGLIDESWKKILKKINGGLRGTNEKGPHCT